MEGILLVICSLLAFAHSQNATIPVRLVGSNGTQGEVETYDKTDRLWKPLCDDGWNLRSATVVCRQLNLGPPVSIYSHASTVVSNYYGTAESDEYFIESLACEGTESSIVDCDYRNYSTYGCHQNETAGVVCSPIQIRLVDGTTNTRNDTTRDGRVEVLSNGEWGTICDVGFDMQDAYVICRQLGFPGVKRVGAAGEYGVGNVSTPIHLSNLQCTGNESEIYQCNGNEQPTGCIHNNDVSVECLPLIRLNDGNTTSDGYLQIFSQGEWYTMCQSSYGTPDDYDAAVVCRELGYERVATTNRRPRDYRIHSHVLWDSLYCYGNESSIYDCNKCCGQFYEGYSCENIPEYACQNLRLTNGDDSSGELEYLSASGWIPVCYTTQFNQHAADVACRQLGYPFAVRSVPTVGNGPGIGIRSSSCAGSESQYLFDCVEFEEITCQTRYHLTCYSNPTIRLVGGPIEYMGRVEVYDRASDQWGTICNSDIEFNSQYVIARLVCNSLGRQYSSAYGPANLSSNIQPSANSPIVNGPIDCGYNVDDYEYLFQCPSFPLNSTAAMLRCTPDQEWVVVCDPRIYLGNSHSSLGWGFGAQGYVEIYNEESGRYELICDEGWDLNDAHVVCRMLGYPEALDATVRSQHGQSYRDNALFSNVQCTGTEDSIFDCPADPNPSCDRSRSAGVRCSATRLVNGSSQYSGRVEFFNRDYHHTYGSYRAFGLQWGTICDNYWNETDASVVCRSLDYRATGGTPHTGGTFGTGSGPIWARNVTCVGTESYIVDCERDRSFNYGGEEPCNHNEDVGVTCLAPLPVRLQGSPHASVGRLEVWRNNMWGSVCNEHFTIEAANVVCRQLGFDQSLDYTTGGYFGQSTGPIHMSNVMCTGNEAAITDCTFSTTHSCDHNQDVGIFCQDIRLNETDTEGFLEANEGSGWGAVCSNYFNAEAAMVACRQLRLGIPVSHHGNTTLASRPYYFLHLYCDGDEQRLSGCNTYTYYNTCYTTYLQCSDVRLEDGVANFSGRVEVLYNGKWGTVCSDEFDENDAAVVCRQAGYGPPVRYWIDPSHRRHGRIWLDDLDCLGTENTLSNCQSSSWGDTNCDHTQDIFVECRGLCNQNINTTGRYFTAEYETTPSYARSTATLRCNEGYALVRSGSAVCSSNGEWIIDYPDCRVPVRLIDESGNTRAVFTGGVQDTSRGRVEVLINRQWRTVCNQGFGFKDANVICNQLGLNGARNIRTGYYGEGSGGIVALQNRGCDGGERNFLDCDLSTTLDCTHADDVGIECIDVRLVPLDNRSYSGRVEVFFNNEWGQVCLDLLRPQALQVVCSQIGYPITMSQPFSSDLPANSRVWIYNLDCIGTESTLLNCPSDVDYHIGKVHGSCYGAASVTCVSSGVCQPFLPPENGYYVNDIRQIYFANSSTDSIQVACKDGYNLVDGYGNPANNTAICQSNGIWNQQFYCFESVQFQYGFKPSAGRVYVRGQSSLFPVCDRNWDLKDATVICRELGYPGAVRATRRSYFTYRNNPTLQPEMETLFSDIDCTGSENSIYDCPDIYGNPVNLIPQPCSSQSIAGVICDENIRLTGGATPYEGRVEVFLKGQWGTVCSTEEVTEAETATLCNSLGFGPPRSVVSGALYADSTDIPILVNNLVCQGAQDDFSQCRIIMNQLSSCTHDSDIGLICSPAVRFVEDNVRSPWEGEIEVYYGRQWDRVCNADWDINDANVVCRELGFSGASSAEYARATPGGYAPVILDGALCVGTETHLLDCPRIVSLSSVTGNCLGNYAGVTCITGCEGLTPPGYGRIVSTTGNNIDDTTTFECKEGFTLLGSARRRCLSNGQWSGVPTQCAGLRLADGLNDLEGRVEIYYQGKWGTVCDEGWDINDGAVVCRQLGYQEVLSVTTMASRFGPGSGPIQLQNVACQGNENNLFMCSLPSDLGEISTCLHNNDAGVTCGGCTVLQSPNYGSISAILDSPEPGDTVTFMCNNGYNLLGSNSRTCLSTGLWSGEVATCQATCKLEDAIKEEKVILDSDNEKETYVEDEQVTVKCDFGYEMAGGINPAIVRVCLSDQTWSGIDPNCTRIEGFPDSGRTTSDDGNDGNDISSSTGVATIVLAVILCLVIVIAVVGLAVFFIQKSRVTASGRVAWDANDDKAELTTNGEADDSNK